VRRSFFIERNLCEYQIISNSVALHLTADEYRERVASLNLNIGEFCLYQDKLFQFKRNLAEVFERLSGSDSFKERYDLLVANKLQCEEHIRVLSEQLKEKRHEKIKLRGLSDYQK
jgi:hypothetical protein